MLHKHIVLLLLATTAPFAATAQASTIADADTGTDAVTWTGTGELGLALARGNARSESVNTRLALGKEGEHWKHDLHASALRSRGGVTGDFDGDGIEEERYELSANRYELGASSARKFDPRNYLVGAAR